MKKVIIISLGGSLIVPNKIQTKYLKEIKKILLKNLKNYKFVIVCGGGSVARNYMSALDHIKDKRKVYFQSMVGIAITRLNARFVQHFFGINQKQGIPHNILSIKKSLKKNSIVFCGGLTYQKKETSDSAAAKIAKSLKCDFINLTNVKGLYDKNPQKYKSAKFIHEISHKEFFKIANKIKYKPGQHFVLDQKASKIIKQNNITTYILGSNTKNLDNLLNHKHFVGTIIKS
ncbi:UMP kinase [Candidatus Pacearchaeota archaeon]|nr:UMP kinase [Candidatus Pacearchaeota archaeon]